uniref:CCHC-type domain-containing protein n=1 Tax=Spongospora subterranea TaxID=70186 RepID=A0A0H5QR01_9EUKA|eukprot:CRZ03911.1 hypothetical protein [Spongospora subterranea]
MGQVYVLRLEGDNIYVGKSDDAEARISKHFRGSGSAWTKLHAPLSVEEIRPMQNDFNEDNVVKEYMMKYGVDQVRGGSYSQLRLDESSLASLEKEIRSATNACFRCGGSNHFSSYCPSRFKRSTAKTGAESNNSPASTKKLNSAGVKRDKPAATIKKPTPFQRGKATLASARTPKPTTAIKQNNPKKTPISKARSTTAMKQNIPNKVSLPKSKSAPAKAPPKFVYYRRK